MFDAFTLGPACIEDHVCYDGSSPGGFCLLAVVAGSVGPLCCGIKMVVVVSTALPVAFYYFVLYFINGPPRVFALT